jgi:hypothetical protein
LGVWAAEVSVRAASPAVSKLASSFICKIINNA